MDKFKYYEITNAQKSIWNTEKYYENNPITNISGTAMIHKPVDFGILEKAINITVERNDALRTKVKIVNDKPMQYFSVYKSFKVDLYKVKNDKELDELVSKFVSIPLRYENDILVRFIMFEFPDKTGGVNIIVNHLLSDAWSTTLIASEVVGNYDKITNNSSIEDSLKSTYTDFIKEEEEYENSERYNKDREFWEKQYEFLPEEIASIKTTNNEQHADTLAKRKEIIIDESESNRIKEYCKENKISPYVFFLGAYTIYLSKMTGQNDVVIGTPILNRKNVKEKQTIGMFVNSLPFRIKLDEEDDVNQYFSKIAGQSMSMFRHQKYSIFEILKYIREKSLRNSNIYDMVFSYQNATSKPTINNIPYTLKWHFNGNISETINIHISDLDSAGKFVIYYDYKVKQLSNAEIKNLNDRIISIINQILNNNIIKIKDISILCDEDIKKIIELNDTGKLVDDNETVSKLFDIITDKYSNNIAIKYRNSEITYEEFNKRVCSLAYLLRREGVKRNIPVALLLDKSIEMIISMFAIIKSGGCYVPILPDEDKKRIEYIINDCKPQLIITNSIYKEKVNDVSIINIDNETFKRLEYKEINSINKSDDIIYIIYTSGSTGNPKGTQIMHKNVCGLINSMKADEKLKPTENDVSMSLLKYNFDASGIDIYSSLLFGGKLLLIEKENELNPKIVVKKMEEEKVTRSFLIPKWVEQIAEEDKKQATDLSHLKILGTGGETIKPKTAEHLFNKYKNLKIVNLYGPTEATMFVTYKILTQKEFSENDTTIGKPIAFSRVLALDKDNNIMPINAKGEMVIYEDENSINNIALGYLNLPEENAKKFKTIYNPIINKKIRVYRTGDYIKINENLDIIYLGRTDDMVKVNGSYLISLNEMENIIYRLLNQKYKVCVVAVPHNNIKMLTCFIENVSQEELEGIKKYINKNITFYMKPKKVLSLNNFPTNNSGKIDRKKLFEIASNNMEIDNKETILPNSQTEEIIYNIIKSCTEIDNISVTDDFMNDLGIDSLMITTIFSELEFYKIKLQDLYTYSNIRSLANYIEIGDNQKKEYRHKELEVINNSKDFNISKILLTGATGFLGIHILRELLYNKKVSKIYCIIRNKEFKTGEERLKERVRFYFKNEKEILELIEKKVIIINGNITEEKMGLEEHQYFSLKNTITSVINCGANVRHYCKLEELIKDNVESVRQILNFCGQTISFAQISTLSIAGFKDIKTLDTIYDESSFYIKQSFNNNPYLISKFLAEEVLLDNKETNIKIFRLGNIMPRQSDGKFQINYNQNAFLNAIRNIVKTKMIPQEILSQQVEFSPVDECASSIMKLIEANYENKIYHILNNNYISINELLCILKNLCYNIEVVNIKEFLETLDSQDEIGKQYIKEYIVQNNLNKYSLEKTIELLKRQRFNWSETDKKYVKAIIDLIEKNRW